MAARFSAQDLAQMHERGITAEQASRQLKLLRDPPYIRLAKPCVPQDGIRVLSEREVDRLAAVYEAARCAGRSAVFVPASGAASRMFESLVAARESGKPNHELQELVRGLPRLAFYKELNARLSAGGFNSGDLDARGLRQFADCLLAPGHLGLGRLPKALIPFHRYAEGVRTAFEEHLMEAAGYAADDSGICRLHFTVLPEHLERFKSFARGVLPPYEERTRCRFDVSFSVQKPSTGTLALGSDGKPLRLPDGRLLFRAGGHGALLDNLSELSADLVFIKNVDNVAVDRLKPEVWRWKKALGGLLVELQIETFRHLEAAESGGEEDLARALDFSATRLSVAPPAALKKSSTAKRREFLLRVLDRPLRVCGVVKNTGEPGGGPFWVKGPSGELTLQIVEGVQVDPASAKGRAIFSSSTHFNPVDLVCGVRDRRGKAFDLGRYADKEAALVSRKSVAGAEAKARVIEHPGLWNGGMAGWGTVFVEVPLATFNPAKTVNDLLRPGHQAEPEEAIR